MANRVAVARGRPMAKHWHLLSASGQTSVGTTQASLASFVPAVGLAAQTLLRSRGELLLVGTPDATTDSDVIGLGLLVAQIAAINAGGTSLPGPINDPGVAWLWYALIALDSGANTAKTATSLTSNHRIEVDSKAMRKKPDGMGVVLVGEATSGDYAAVTVTGAIRLLFGE